VKVSRFDNRLFPWLAGGIALMLSAAFVLWDTTWGERHSEAMHTLVEAVFFALLFGVIYWFWVQRTRTQDEMRIQLRQAEITNTQIHESSRRLEAVFRINRISVEANDEREMINLALQLSAELTGAKVASFVPLDEHCQPLAVINFGEQPPEKLNALIEYLASPEVHERCSTCSRQDGIETCPMLAQFSGDEMRIFCFPLNRGEHKFGMLNLYMPKKSNLLPETRSFVQAMADEIALSLDGVRLRQRELTTLRQLQRVRAKADLEGLLAQMLENVRAALETDFATLILQEGNSENTVHRLTSGEIPDAGGSLVMNFLMSALQSGEPIRVGEIASGQDAAHNNCSVMAVPLISQNNHTLGSILVGNRRATQFQVRQLALLQTVAGQVALVIHNAHLMTELEYNTTLGERTRLAREIHDGLAQTLGFLKLQMIQMQKAFDQQNFDQLKRGITLSYQAVSSAYEDAREAIDDLFMDPSENSFIGWVEQIAAEFEENTAITVSTSGVNAEINLPPEIQIQLIRIIQESLSNIRKHAEANHVVIACDWQGKEVFLEISDNGCGFFPSETQGASRHGLRGMRERADLIGADFQLTSRPGAGAAVHLRWTPTPAQVVYE